MRVESACLAFVLLTVVGARAAGIEFYPTVLDTATNLLSDAQWAHEPADGTMTFAASGGIRRVEALHERGAYWFTSAPVAPGRRYLAGYRARFADAKTLFWTYGRNAATGAMEDYRLYMFGGVQKHISWYLSEPVMKHLAGDSEAWRLVFRPLEFPQGLADGCLTIGAGVYPSVGSMEFRDAFLVDVTDVTDFSLTIRATGPRPVKRLVVFRVGIRDTVWTHVFDVPQAEFTIRPPAELVDWRLGLEEAKNVLNGHGLEVNYENGDIETKYAPQEYAFRVRVD